MGSPPKFRAFLTDETGKRVLEDDDGKWIEFAALWEDRYPDKDGNPVYSGRTGKGDQRLRVYIVEPRPPKDDAPTETPRDTGGDVPF